MAAEDLPLVSEAGQSPYPKDTLAYRQPDSKQRFLLKNGTT
jgi:hypothetical protein